MSEIVFVDSSISNLNINGIAFDGLGNLYSSNFPTNSISKITSNGTISTFATGLIGPRDIVFDNLGNLYCANIQSTPSSTFGSITKITTDGSRSAFARGISQPYGLAFDSSGILYCSSTTGYIAKITQDGSVSTFVGGLGNVTDIIFDNSRNLYCLGDGNLRKITSNGLVSTFAYGTSGLGLCFDGISNFYSGSNSPGIILKINIDGSVSTFANNLSGYIRFLTFDNSGNLYCSTSTGKVLKFSDVIAKPPLLPISNICFPAGTPINTDQGLIPIEQINSDVCTIRGNKIETITKTVTQDKYLVCIEKDALAKNIPSQKTIISKNHGLLYNGKMIKSKDLLTLNNEGIYKVKYNEEILYNVLLQDKHDKMLVNNLICETLNPENGIARMYLYLKNSSYNPKEKQEFIKEYNEYVTQNKTFNLKK